MKQKLALLLTALLLLTGCSSGGSGDTADGQDDGELETIDVVLDWYPNAVHAFLYEAEEKGYFAEEGLQVNILFPSNASDPLTMTAAGRADIGFYYQEDTIIAKANEDVPVKVLGAVVQQPGHGGVARLIAGAAVDGADLFQQRQLAGQHLLRPGPDDPGQRLSLGILHRPCLTPPAGPP